MPIIDMLLRILSFILSVFGLNLIILIGDALDKKEIIMHTNLKTLKVKGDSYYFFIFTLYCIDKPVIDIP